MSGLHAEFRKEKTKTKYRSYRASIDSVTIHYCPPPKKGPLRTLWAAPLPVWSYSNRKNHNFMWATNYLMEMSQMCQTLHNILKSFAYDAIPATPTHPRLLCPDSIWRLEAKRRRDRQISESPSLSPTLPLFLSLCLSPSFSLSLAFCAVGGCQAVDRLLVSVGPGVLSSSFS